MSASQDRLTGEVSDISPAMTHKARILRQDGETRPALWVKDMLIVDQALKVR